MIFQYLFYYFISVIALALVGAGVYYTIIYFNYFEGYLFDYYVFVNSEDEDDIYVKLRIYTPTQVLVNIMNGGTKLPRIGADDGYCYLYMVPEIYRKKMKKNLGKYPTFGRIYSYCREKRISLRHVKSHLNHVQDNLYHYDVNYESENEIIINSEMVVGGFSISNINSRWYVSNKVFLGLALFVVLIMQYGWMYCLWFFGVKWYSFFYIVSSFVAVPVCLYYLYYMAKCIYLNWKISAIYGDGTDDIATCYMGRYELKESFMEGIINEDDVDVQHGRTLPVVGNSYQEYVSYPAELGVRYTTGQKDYVISAPKEMESTFRMLKDYFRMIAHGFRFELLQNVVTTGHDLSTMINKLVRKTINNEIPAGKRVLHVGENVIAMSKDLGHVCCNPQTEPNDANRHTNAINFIHRYNNENERRIEYIDTTFSEVASRFDIVTAIHSVYNQPFIEFFTNCVKVNAHTVYVALHFNPLVLSHDHFQMPFSKFIVDQDKERNLIKFKHNNTDEKSYHHDRSEYFKYLFVDTVKVKYQGRDMYYHRKVIMNCCDVIVFRYDMNAIPPIQGQVENLNMALGDKFIGYYKLKKMDTTLDFLTTQFVPEMIFVSTEFDTAMKSKQFDGVERKGYAIETALYDGKNERSRVYRFFSKIFDNTDRDLDLLAMGLHDYEQEEIYEIEDYKQVTLVSAMATLDAHTFPFENQIRYEDTLVANKDVVQVGAGFKVSDNILNLLVKLDTMADQTKWNNAAETFARQPVCLLIENKYIVNRKALNMNVRNVIFITKENNRYYRSNYAGEEMNHNIGNEKDLNVSLVTDFNMFYLLSQVEFEFIDEPIFDLFDNPPPLGTVLNTNTVREAMRNNNGMIIKSGKIYLPHDEEQINAFMRIYFIKTSTKYLKCGHIIQEDDVLLGVLNRMEILDIQEFSL